ncbi:Met-10+ like-protein-domain-containing protein [Bisporella sp. PMI_857]|nr:Met-10+ like-protein-domain-containing protein [Bisporella sp. PMI_857]
MPIATREKEIYRQDAKSKHKTLSVTEREKLIAKNANIPSIKAEEPDSRSRLGVRKFLKTQLHVFIYFIIHAIFSLYIRFRQAYHAVKDRIFAILYYHHRTPELIQKDVKGLSRLPQHLSVLLNLEDGGKGGAGLETLVDEMAEIAAWCACVGIPKLSVYEQTGILKGYLPASHRTISRKLSSYFGSQQPALSLRAPHVPCIESVPATPVAATAGVTIPHLSILLISEEDGRDSLVDLTKTLAEMTQRSKISSNDISIDLVDAEISESVMSEPDLLVLFGPSIELSGYPPWQLRLTEIFHVQDNHGVGYQENSVTKSPHAMSLFRPPVVRSASAVLDRALFSKTIPTAAARVFNNKKLSDYVKKLEKSKEVLGLERLKPVTPDPDTAFASKGGKCILLKPEVKPEDPSTWSEIIQEAVKTEEIRVIPYDLKLDYNYWTYYDIMSALLPEDAQNEIPVGFTVVGHVAHLNLRDEYLPYKNTIAEVVKDKNPQIRTVINKTANVGQESEFRTFPYEVLLGEDDLNVEVSEASCTFKFDYSRVYWNSRLETEHKRLVDSFGRGEVVCDVMAGIGPFAVPAGKKGVFVWANDLNPESYTCLIDAIKRNKVEKFVRPFNEDGHTFIQHAADDLLQLSADKKNTVTIPAKYPRGFKTDKSKVIPAQTITIPSTISHFVMNLPAIAIDFLGSFNGLYHGREDLFEPLTKTKLPMIHVHCFSTKSHDNTREYIDICERISEKIRYEIKVGDAEMDITDFSDVSEIAGRRKYLPTLGTGLQDIKSRGWKKKDMKFR